MEAGSFCASFARIANEVDLFIDPKVSRYGFFDILAFERLREIGYRAGQEALAGWKAKPDYPGTRS